MKQLPVACSLDARELAQRQADLRQGILARAISIETLPDGRRWRFRESDGLLSALGAVIDAERRCCRFLNFALTAEPDLGEVTLDVTGPEGTREALAAWT